ncbi:hypothetical protein CS0771_40120 [Catellatospora sp. IY07-71]|uniref:hypothetical protein n=1 Tax=Catellatospora sp. IY07-71 TaxID=2728827 RepID=UPI001BB316B5|nr:hypothetical protein [Catellatospora sp. IY07-71]BCJ74468.1 hypothetical protein CS0771_40120 [Catellatospora sp. IY07-71]
MYHENVPLGTALRRLWWRVVNSLWLVVTPAGLTGPALVVLGVIASRRSWWIPGLLYTAVTGAAAAALTLPAAQPGWAAPLMAGTWLVGLVHAGFVNMGWLEWRAGNTDWSVKV